MKFVSMIMAACLMVRSNATSLRRTKEVDETKRKVLAKLQLSDDVSVTFIGDGPGVLVTAEASNEGAELLEEALSGLDKPTLVDTWKALTKDDVPKELEEADKRIKMLPVEHSSPSDGALEKETVPEKGNGGMAKCMTCNEFEENHCYFTSNSRCWSCVTGDGWLARATSFMISKTHVQQGRITMNLRVMDCSWCNWRTVFSTSVDEGITWYQWAENYYAVKAEVTNALWDDYHWTMMWE